MKKGDKFRITDGSSCHGLLCELVRQSKATGDCTVKLLEERGGPTLSNGFQPCWKIGDVVQVHRYELTKDQDGPA
jgi:hypothetical protein